MLLYVSTPEGLSDPLKSHTDNIKVLQMLHVFLIAASFIAGIVFSSVASTDDMKAKTVNVVTTMKRYLRLYHHQKQYKPYHHQYRQIKIPIRTSIENGRYVPLLTAKDTYLY